MRKPNLQGKIPVDVFIANPNGEINWMVWKRDDTLKNYSVTLRVGVHCIVKGRKLAEGFIPQWAGATLIENEEQTFSMKMNETPKVVFTKIFESADWSHIDLDKKKSLGYIKQTLRNKTTIISKLTKYYLYDI